MSKLKDFCLNITDGEHGTVIDDINGAYYLLSNKNIINGHIVISNDDRRISKESFEKINKRTKLEKNDVLISTVGTIGKTAIVEENNYVVQRSVGIIKTDSKKLNPKYLIYYLNQDYYQIRLVSLSKGAVQKCLFISDLKDLDIDVPSIDIQNAIVERLSCIDNKINNNNKIIAELESMANTLYDYWFLQFEFPNEEGKPYKSSGGKMVYNEELKREIPEDWKVENVKNHCKITWGQCPDGANILPLNTDEDSMLYCSGAGDMRNGLLVDCQARTNASKRTAKMNDILMSVAGSIGAICYCDQIISLGRAAVAFTPKINEELFTLMSVKTFSDRMKTVSSGSIQKVVNDNHLDDMNLVFDEKVLARFSKYNSLLNKMVNLCKENKELASLRDFLLPMLMNGQVTFK